MVKQKKPLKKKIIYLDSCVLLDSISLCQGFTHINSKRKFNIGEINPQKAEIFVSYINIIEITEHLKDSVASQMAFDEGYSYFDLNKHRIDDIEISEEKIIDINNIIKKELVELPSVVTLKPSGLSAKDIGLLVQLCNQYSLFFIDALHFLITDKSGCNLFITSDITFRKRLKQIIEYANSENEMQVQTPQEFKNFIFKSITYK